MKRDKPGLLLSREDVRAQLDRAGMTIKEWSDHRGYDPEVLQDLLRGKTKGRRGAAHNVAVLVGLKLGVINPAHVPKPSDGGGGS